MAAIDSRPIFALVRELHAVLTISTSVYGGPIIAIVVAIIIELAYPYQELNGTELLQDLLHFVDWAPMDNSLSTLPSLQDCILMASS